MPTITEAIQTKIRSITGLAYDYEGDWHAYLDEKGIPQGMFNERVLALANSQDPTIKTYSAAMNYFANTDNISGTQSKLDEAITIITSYSGSLWIADPAYCYIDIAGTIPCQNGDRVAFMRDLAGTMHAIQPVFGIRPFLRLIGGIWALEFFAVGDFMNVSARGDTLAGVKYTTMGAFASYELQSQATLFSGTDAGANTNLQVTQLSTGFVQMDQGSNQQTSSNSSPLGSRVIATARLTTATMEMRLNKVSSSKVNVSNLVTNNGWRMGTGNGDHIRYIFCAMAAPAQMTLQDIEKLETYGALRAGITL